MAHRAEVLAVVLLMGVALCCAPSSPTPTAPVVTDPSSAAGLNATPASPIRLELRGETRGEETIIDLTVEVVGRLREAPEVQLRAGERATLSDGRAIPRVRAPSTPGRDSRRFVLRHVEGPVVASVDIQGDSYGFHAEAQWPKQEEVPVTVPAKAAIPPTSIYGVTVDHAIPLQPKPEPQAQ